MGRASRRSVRGIALKSAVGDLPGDADPHAHTRQARSAPATVAVTPRRSSRGRRLPTLHYLAELLSGGLSGRPPLLTFAAVLGVKQPQHHEE